MANNENYIGVAMGMDVTDLKAGLSEANKQIQLANSEFKAASSGMEDWQKSTEGIAAKIKQLDTVLSAQKSKLSGLQAEYAKVAKEQGEGSEAARKLQVQINNQQAVVNKTQQEFENYTKTLEDAENGTIDLEKVSLRAGKAVASMGDGANEAGGKLDGLKNVGTAVVGGIAAIGAAAGAAIGSFLSLAESTRETRENMAKLETGFTTAGHSAEDASETYKELFGILGDEGQATEAAAHLAKLTTSQEELAKWTDISAGVYATFGDSLPIEGLAEAANETAKTGSLTGGLADALNWAGESEDEFQAKLDACTTEQERQALITDTLNGLYSESADKFKELNKDVIAAREADAALTEAMAELGAIAEPIMTSLKMLAVDLLGALQPFVQMMGEGLQGALSGTAGAAEQIADGLSGIFETLIGKVREVLPMVLDVIVQLVPQIIMALLDAVPDLLRTLINIVEQVMVSLSTILPQIIAAVVDLVPQIITNLLAYAPDLLQAAITLLMSIVEAIPEIITNLIEWMPEVIWTIIDTITQGIPMLLDAAIQLLNAIIEAIPVLIDSLVTNFPLVIETIVDGVIDSVPMLLDAAINFFTAIIDAIPKIITSLIKELPKIIETILDAVMDAVPKLLDAAISLFTQIVEAIPDFLPDLISMLPKIQATIITAVAKAAPKLLTAAIQLFLEIVKAIPKMLVTLVKEIPTIIKAIVKGLADGATELFSAGEDIVKGIWEGISGAASWLKEKISGFAGNVAGWFKKTFKIESPSRLMEDEVGQYIGEGVGVGILDSIPTVKKQLSKFSDFVTENMGGIKDNLSFGGVSYSGSGPYRGMQRGDTHIDARMTVNYNGNLSRKQIRQLENDNYLAVKTKLAAEGVI